MPISSNLYAEKVFSEHPLALWPLDEKADYVSLLSDPQRDFMDSEFWEVSGGEVEEITENGPLATTPTRRVLGDEPSSGGASITLVGPETVDVQDLDLGLNTFTIALYVYSETSFIRSVDIGYQLDDEAPVFKSSSFTLLQAWRNVSRTFAIPSSEGTIRPVIRINYVSSDSPTEYGFWLNGLTFGQWSEQFNLSSLGVTTEPVDSNIALDEGTLGLKIDAYGAGKPGYYLGSKTSLASKNFGVPLVFGSDNVTTLRDNGDSPSIIVPAYGFLNRLGQFREATLEFWLKVNSSSDYPVPIVKAMGSNDGLYVDKGFIVVVVNGTSASHFVGEWGRPMLIDFAFTSTFASLLINGEQVVSLQINTSDLNLAPHIDANGKSQDWLEFFSPSDIGPIQIDCIGIYPYQVSEILAKRRLVYGQAVDLSENTNSSYTSSAISLGYFSSNYSNNYNYPDSGKWESGIYSNLEIDKTSISIPSYNLPTVALRSKSYQEWISDVSSAQSTEDKWFSLRPNDEWQSEDGHLFFPNLNSIANVSSAIYGVFEAAESTSQTLFRLVDTRSSNHFEILLEDDKVLFNLNYNGTESTVFVKEGIDTSTKFLVGIDVDRFAQSFGGSLLSFMGNKKNLSLYVGGTPGFQQTFSGKIYSINFANKSDLNNIQDLIDGQGILYSGLVSLVYEGEDAISDFDGGVVSPQFFGLLDGGSPDTDYSQSVDGGNPESIIFSISERKLPYSAYTLVLNEYFSAQTGHELSIASRATWQDYIPLSHLGKLVKNAENQNYQSLDFVQINFDYPLPKVSQAFYNTSNEVLKAYVTFQQIRSGASKTLDRFPNTVAASKIGVVEPGSYTLINSSGNSIKDSFVNTKYEIVNGMIVYPPAGIKISELAIVVHFEIDVPSIQRYPMRLDRLEIAALALDDIAENPVGTNTGTPIFPYTKLNIYFDYKKRNPFEIYKGNTPYLYLTNNSGVRLKGESEEGVSRGISMPINQGRASSYNVGAVQFNFRYDEDIFSTQAIELFEVEAANTYIKYYLVAADDSGKRGRIYGIDTSTGAFYRGMGFFLNGVLVRDVIIDNKEWITLGIQFTEALNFANFVGAFRSTGPMLINNIYHYQFASYEEDQTVKTRPWINVLNTVDGTARWEDYEELTWLDVLFILTTERTYIDPARIYRVYTGTNKFVSGDDKAISLRDYEYRFYRDIVWQTNILDAV